MSVPGGGAIAPKSSGQASNSNNYQNASELSDGGKILLANRPTMVKPSDLGSCVANLAFVLLTSIYSVKESNAFPACNTPCLNV
jgi:hypothetical protein